MLLGLTGLGLILAGGWHAGDAGSIGSGASRSVTLVVAARSLDAGTVLASSDVSEVTVAASDPLSPFAHASAGVVGRRLAVAVPPGAPLGSMLLSQGSAPAAGRRLVRVPVDGTDLGSDVVPGVLVDAVAAVPQGSDGGRVVAVATGRVVSVASGSTPVVTLDVDATAAPRLIWAQTFAKSLHLLVRSSAADQPPPDVGGLT
ncbi:MAG TPA: SAF domain-containing protein [Candidatus Angelobacter sp.]|nr:SAF domain-containing protein [Candidatus Angelobacter sp.]